MKRHAATPAQNAEFSKHFAAPLHVYLDPFLGFDIVKFDDEIVKAPAGVSTAQHLKKAFPQGAYALVAALLEV